MSIEPLPSCCRLARSSPSAPPGKTVTRDLAAGLLLHEVGEVLRALARQAVGRELVCELHVGGADADAGAMPTMLPASAGSRILLMILTSQVTTLTTDRASVHASAIVSKPIRNDAITRSYEPPSVRQLQIVRAIMRTRQPDRGGDGARHPSRRQADCFATVDGLGVHSSSGRRMGYGRPLRRRRSTRKSTVSSPIST